MSEFDDFSADDLRGYNDWGIEPHYEYEDVPQYEDDLPDYLEDYDPAFDVVDIIELGIEVTPEGFLLECEIHVFADEHREASQRILEITCWDGELPF